MNLRHNFKHNKNKIPAKHVVNRSFTLRFMHSKSYPSSRTPKKNLVTHDFLPGRGGPTGGGSGSWNILVSKKNSHITGRFHDPHNKDVTRIHQLTVEVFVRLAWNNQQFVVHLSKGNLPPELLVHRLGQLRWQVTFLHVDSMKFW